MVVILAELKMSQFQGHKHYSLEKTSHMLLWTRCTSFTFVWETKDIFFTSKVNAK